MFQMLQTCEIFPVTINKFGEDVLGSSIAYPCKFRYIDALDKQSNREGIQSDAMAWFETTTTVVEGSIFRVDGEVYRVQKIIKARRLNSNNILFIKTYLERYYDTDVS